MRMFFDFQRAVSSLPSALREFIGDLFILHTYPHTHTHKHTFFSFDIFLRQWTSLSTCSKRSSLLVDLSNASKTKGLNANQALNKNSSNGKKQKNVNCI